tara:strand:+ start:117 stop:470 length:354 start_codon:yes stop_codon:yes gene_type:complete
MRDFPNGIRTCRKRAKLTMTELAERAGTSRSQIYKLEAGERQLTLEWMQRLAKAIGCTLEELLPVTAKHRFQGKIPELSDKSYQIQQHDNYIVLRLEQPVEVHLSLHPLFADPCEGE